MRHQEFYDTFEDVFKEAKYINLSTLKKFVVMTREIKPDNELAIRGWLESLQMNGFIQHVGGNRWKNLKFKEWKRLKNE